MTPAQVRQVDPPADVRALSTLPVIDYADSFTVTGGAGERTAEQWARAVLTGAPPRVRFKLVAGWTFLGLRLGIRPPAERILGWRIRRSTPDVLLLGAGSRLGLPPNCCSAANRTACCSPPSSGSAVGWPARCGPG